MHGYRLRLNCDILDMNPLICGISHKYLIIVHSEGNMNICFDSASSSEASGHHLLVEVRRRREHLAAVPDSGSDLGSDSHAPSETTDCRRRWRFCIYFSLSVCRKLFV